ncbi:MAG: glycosyltransferase [Actinobacteria bacterium]|nr:glycosyltransferase [Actinomycetota bacterium]
MVKKKRVCHISTVHPLFDDRIFYKECVSLSNNSYDVFLVISHSFDEVIQNINIISLNTPTNRAERFFRNTFLAFRKALAIKPDVIHFHDPELLGVGVLFRLLGKKVIYDVHEDVAKQILYKNWIGSVWFRFIVSGIVAFIEYFASLFFNKIIVVTEDIQKNFPASKTVLIRNFPRLDMIRNAATAQLVKKKKVVIYVGNLAKVRGIKELIDAIGYVDAELWLVGDWESEEYETVCKTSDGWQKTNFFGQKKLEEVYGYLKLADVGIALLYPIKNYLTSLPVKAFEYMALGIPMIVSDFPYWKEIFSGCAEFANPFKSDEIVEKLNLLLTNKQISGKLSSHAVHLIESGYSWEVESKKLITLYKELWNEN